MSITNFPDSQTLTLQQEALRRVREMQQRARQSVEQVNAYNEFSGWNSSEYTPPPQNTAFPRAVQQPGQTQPQTAHQMPPQGQSQQPNVQTSQNAAPSFQFPNQQSAANPPQYAQQQNRQQHNMSQPNNILAHLFGGGRPPINQGSGSPNNSSGNNNTNNRGPNQGPNANQPRSSGGLLDLLRRQGVGESFSGLGETLQGTISSVSEPLSNLLDSFGIDGEKLIILLVMWAIFNEHKENKTLLLALGYLLL